MEQYLTENNWILWPILSWVLAWKGVALWKAARNTNKKWFVVLLVANTLGILEMLYIFFYSKKKEEKV
jgi:hypothetical protein